MRPVILLPRDVIDLARATDRAVVIWGRRAWAIDDGNVRGIDLPGASAEAGDPLALEARSLAAALRPLPPGGLAAIVAYDEVHALIEVPRRHGPAETERVLLVDVPDGELRAIVASFLASVNEDQA